MKAGADFQQAAHAAAELDPAVVGSVIRERIFSRVALAPAVAADDAQHLAGPDLETDVLKRQKSCGTVARRLGEAPRRPLRQALPQREIFRLLRSGVERKPVAEAIDAD